jgi:hypothetical protein
MLIIEKILKKIVMKCSLKENESLKKIGYSVISELKFFVK